MIFMAIDGIITGISGLFTAGSRFFGALARLKHQDCWRSESLPRCAPGEALHNGAPTGDRPCG